MQLCGAVPDLMISLPPSHREKLEKKIRRLVKDHLKGTKPTINTAEFNRGISDTFIEFMVSIFGKYRAFIGKVSLQWCLSGGSELN